MWNACLEWLRKLRVNVSPQEEAKLEAHKEAEGNMGECGSKNTKRTYRHKRRQPVSRRTQRKTMCSPKKGKSRCPMGKKKNACKKMPVRITDKGYLSFLRHYRKEHGSSMSAKDVVINGARAWCKMDDCERERFRKN